MAENESTPRSEKPEDRPIPHPPELLQVPEVDTDDAVEAEGTDVLEDETGIDLSDASELDADNVPADEEHDRVGHAPD